MQLKTTDEHRFARIRQGQKLSRARLLRSPKGDASSGSRVDCNQLILSVFIVSIRGWTASLRL